MKINKKGIKKDCCLLGILILYLLWCLLSIDNITKYGILINTTFLLVTFFITTIFFGLRIERNAVLRKRIRSTLLLYFLFYYVIVYAIGIFFGYQINPWRIDSVINIILYVLGGLFLELIRYMTIYRNINKKILYCLYTISFSIIISISFVQIVGDFNNTIFIFITIYSFLLSYISYHLGYSISIFYRVFFELLFLSVPVIPNLNFNFLMIVMFLFVIFTWSWIRSETMIFDKVVEDRKVVVKRILLNATLSSIIFVITFILVTGITDFSLIGIASSSMSPSIKIGDMLVIKNNYSKDKYSKNDIVVFEHNNKKIVHRIISKKYVNGDFIYEVKGDNNRDKDNILLKNDDIQGKIIYRIPYIAYPAVELKKIIKG